MFLLLFFSINVYGQFPPGIKHIEIVSEIQDSMVILNKTDVDKINKTYFEKEKLDSINVYNEKTISLLEEKINIKDSIINNNRNLLNNELSINKYLKESIEINSNLYEKSLRQEKAKKICWQTTTGAAILGVILVLIFK